MCKYVNVLVTDVERREISVFLHAESIPDLTHTIVHYFTLKKHFNVNFMYLCLQNLHVLILKSL